jgi:hypothetical protein
MFLPELLETQVQPKLGIRRVHMSYEALKACESEPREGLGKPLLAGGKLARHRPSSAGPLVPN